MLPKIAFLPQNQFANSILLQREPHLRLHYIVDGEHHYDYWVELEPVASNLPGASSSCRYYMVCPQTGRRTTVRYLRSGAGIFAHREAFASPQRLYDDSQLEPKRFRGLSSYFAVDREWPWLKVWYKG